MPGFGRLLAAVAALFLLTAPGLAQAKWLKAESARFIVYSDGDEQTLRHYVTRLEDFDTILRASHGLDPDEVPLRKLEIYMVRDIVEMRRVMPQAPDTLGGFYASGMGDLFAVSLRTRVRDDYGDDILLHEYTHHFMRQYMTPRYPGWLVEGYAEYFATAKLTTTRFELGLPNLGRLYQLRNERWISSELLLTEQPYGLDAEQRSAFYAQAWLLTHYMKADKARFAQLKAYEAALVAGKDSKSAWLAATGEDLATLDTKLRAYAKGQIISLIYTRARTLEPAPVMVTVLPPSADDFLLARQQLRHYVPEDDRPAFLATLRGRAAKHPGDRLARLTLAQAEIDFGDRGVGDRLLDEVIAANPADAEALRTKALAMMDDDDSAQSLDDRYAAAGKLLIRANKAEPDDYRTLVAYARTRQVVDDDYPSDNTLNVLLLASQLAPQVAETRLGAARGLMLQKQFDEAILQLNPVANDPHGGGAAEAARSLLRQIVANR